VAILRKHSMASLASWIEKHTTLGGNPFSYVDHEYQIPILSDTSREVNVRKCSQVGVSEASARLALAMVNVVQPLTAIYTLPTAHFSATFMKTRMDPIISGSKVMKESIHKTNDNSELKQFGDSFLYVKGAASSNAPISIPADVIISDETDFSDQEVLSQYSSRLTHSKWKIQRKFSTPTIPGYGVDKAFQSSRRHFNLCKCHHCNHWFQPSYYDHVKIPGYTEDLRAINKQTLTRINWDKAVLVCPKCGGVPSLQVAHRQYVCENPDEKYVGAGYQVSPFDAPNIIMIPDLVKASTDYQRVQDFVNFGLGLPMEDSEATLTRADFLHLFSLSDPGNSVAYVMGIDVGNVYHFVVAAVDWRGDMYVVHTEQVPMGRAKLKYHELRRQFRVVCSVIDSGPHAETVMALQNEDPNLYASVYMRSKSMLTHTVHDKEEVKEEGQEFLRQVNVNRNRALDAYMNYIRENHLGIRSSMNDDLFIAHHTSMKRVKIFDNDSGEMAYSWQKTDGEDHFHHAGLYCWVAGRIKGVGRPSIILPVGVAMKIRTVAKSAATDILGGSRK
jgi:hypothetical protein